MASYGRLEAIWLKRMKSGPMDPVDRAVLEAGRGLVGNADQGGRRQVTIIEAEVWQLLMSELGATADPSGRRANLMVRGVSLRESRGRHLLVGGCRIEIMGETRPCRQMEDAAEGLMEAMRGEWRGGAFGVVLEGGEIRVGDDVSLVQSPSAPSEQTAP